MNGLNDEFPELNIGCLMLEAQRWVEENPLIGIDKISLYRISDRLMSLQDLAIDSLVRKGRIRDWDAMQYVVVVMLRLNQTSLI